MTRKSSYLKAFFLSSDPIDYRALFIYGRDRIALWNQSNGKKKRGR